MSADAPVSPRQRGAELDRLAALEEERRFLLRSLADLEREREAGDVDEADYATLRDGYTARAAEVLRRIEEGRAGLTRRSAPRAWKRTALIAVAVIVASVGVGAVLANAWGERGAGQEITGFTPGDDARTLLASARSAMNQGDFGLANELYRRVDEMERERDVANPEARTYFGWTLALLTVGDPDEERATSFLDAARLALAQAIEMDPSYADPYCFLAIIEYQFRDDPEAALGYVETCESSNPPADVADLIAGFADEIRTAAT